MTSTFLTRSTAGVRDRLALAVLLTASFTLAVDFSILNVALPAIGADVGFALSGLQWIATSFALCAAGFTLLFGRVADLAGRRRVFLAGIALLGVSSLAGGLATGPAVLLVARVAQGLATAAVTPAALALLTTSFPEGPRRDRALGLNGALMAAGFTTGAILGGVITDLLSWRWAFFINVVVAAAVLAVAPVVLVESRPERRPRLDVPGAVTVTAGLLAVVFGLVSAGQHGWVDPRAPGGLLAGALLLGTFWVIERRVAEPLVPVRILRRRTVAWGNLAGILAFATETSLVFLLTLYLQEVLGFAPLAAGLSFAVLGLGTVLGGVLGPRVIARLGNPQRALALGMSVQAMATLVLVFLGPDRAGMPLLLAATFIGGTANLVAIVGFMVTATSGLPDGEQGLAAGLATMSQQIGITLGIPVMSAVVSAGLASPGGEATGDILTAVRTAVVVNAALCMLTAAAVALFLRAPRTGDVGRAPRTGDVSRAGNGRPRRH
ncbi:MFS transporter [Actinoplanes cyaneus]|uniref:MFS transporter n=1 Tax=Actinoplanes cyaneus TaxID=52696 RepID=A0A919MBV9_9ACTN|nr:MFS transporter [Actinoplanes cyaneus]MCW2140181.1 drug resistance transporter, EmrB/QacA subfamily [Actinoplanes cyaneus]GID65496.1 MFS transporter [Actinoplanes cyaneus]